jgi:hypothetical protein
MTLPVAVRDRFLGLLAETGSVSRSAALAGINRHTAYQWRDGDADYSVAWERALEASREQLRERVVETACLLGLARMVPVVDALTGEPVLDDELEPVTQPDVSGVDARVLIKLIDRTMRSADGPAVNAIQVNSTVRVERPPRPRLVRPGDVQDAEFTEADPDE